MKIKNLRLETFLTCLGKNTFFDCVIDNFSVYANTNKVIKKNLFEVHRVLKKNGSFFQRFGVQKLLDIKKWKKNRKRYL